MAGQYQGKGWKAAGGYGISRKRWVDVSRKAGHIHAFILIALLYFHSTCQPVSSKRKRVDMPPSCPMSLLFATFSLFCFCLFFFFSFSSFFLLLYSPFCFTILTHWASLACPNLAVVSRFALSYHPNFLWLLTWSIPLLPLTYSTSCDYHFLRLSWPLP